MLLSESFSRIQSPARDHVKDKLACAVTPTCTHFPAIVRQSMRNGVTASSFKSNTCDCSVCGSRATNLASPAQISTVRVKRQSARSRTANITARADRQGMNSNAEYAQKPDKQILTLPTVLTLMRVASIPVLIGVWFSNLSSASVICSGVFIAACLTDYLDGYLARRMGTTSAFGAFLDPVADKLMVATVLILLASEPLKGGPWSGNTWLLPSLSSAIIGREITMSALREWAASCSQEAHQAVAVSNWGKWKTATQMTAISLLLATSGSISNQGLQLAASLAAPLLCVATFLTLWSLAEYMRGVWPYM